MIERKTTLTLTHQTKAGTFEATYELHGEIVAPEQLTSFTRDSTVAFWKMMEAAKRKAL